MSPVQTRKPARRKIDIEAIRQNHLLPDVAGQVISLKPAGREWIGCCPFHADRSPSLTIYDNGRRFHCFGCGASGDVLDFVQLFHRVNLPDAAKMLAAGQPISNELPTLSPVEHHDRANEARLIWKRAAKAEGTLAETYVRFRGISLPIPSDIRFARLHYDDLGLLPCLVAAVRDVSGEITGVQRIWLAHDGKGKADVPNPKRSFGRIKGGAIRLGRPDGTGVITVCEGPEDGLSLLEMLDIPVWVAAGATFLSAMQFPREVHTVNIGADNDAAGEAEARKASRAFAARGLTVRIFRPLEIFKDFNDELKECR